MSTENQLAKVDAETTLEEKLKEIAALELPLVNPNPEEINEARQHAVDFAMLNGFALVINIRQCELDRAYGDRKAREAMQDRVDLLANALVQVSNNDWYALAGCLRREAGELENISYGGAPCAAAPGRLRQIATPRRA